MRLWPSALNVLTQGYLLLHVTLFLPKFWVTEIISTDGKRFILRNDKAVREFVASKYQIAFQRIDLPRDYSNRDRNSSKAEKISGYAQC